MALTDFSSPPELHEAASTNHDGALSFEKVSRKSQHAVRKATEMFLTQVSTGTCTLPIAMPCESQKPAHYLQSNSEKLFWKPWMSWTVLFISHCSGRVWNNDAQWTGSPRDELGPTIGGTTISTTTVPLPLHTQMLVQVNYAGKWSGIWASGQRGTFLLRWEQIQRMRHGMEGVNGVQQVSI